MIRLRVEYQHSAWTAWMMTRSSSSSSYTVVDDRDDLWCSRITTHTQPSSMLFFQFSFCYPPDHQKMALMLIMAQEYHERFWQTNHIFQTRFCISTVWYFYFPFFLGSYSFATNESPSQTILYLGWAQPSTQNKRRATATTQGNEQTLESHSSEEDERGSLYSRSKTILYSVDGRSEQTRWAGKNMNPQYTSLYENVESVCSFPPMVAFLTGATTLTFLGMTESLAQLSTHLPTRWTISSLSISTNRLFDS